MSRVSFEQVQVPRLWTVAVEQLRTKIEQGELVVGARLPSERDLCAELGISRVSLREALRVLQATGYVETRHGSGTFARLPEERSSSGPTWIAHDIHVEHLLEMRLVIEPDVAALAASRCTKQDIELMQTAIDEAHRGLEESDKLLVVAADAEFHRVLGLSVQNDALAQLIHQLQDLSGSERRASLSVPGQIVRAIRDHQNILDAIAMRDPLDAREQMRSHLQEALEKTHEYAEALAQMEERENVQQRSK